MDARCKMSLNTAHAPDGVLVVTGELWPYTRRKCIGYIILVVFLFVFLLVLRNEAALQTTCREGADRQRILLYCDGVDVKFGGADAKKFQGTTKGRIYLTTHRVVFVNKDGKESLQSFSFPFMSISDLKLEQPVFGANYIQGKVTAEKNGNWTGKCTFNVRFAKGGAIEFGQAMMAAIKRAAQQEGVTAPTSHEPPSGPYVLLSYIPAPGFNNGFPLPYGVFPDHPPDNTVYAANAPPHYPGVYVLPQQKQGAMPSAPVASSSSDSNSSAGGPSAPAPADFKPEW